MMNKWIFIFSFFGLIHLGISAICQENTIMTVKGEIPSRELGQALIHEHILVDFIGADKTDPSRWNKKEVVQKVLPYVQKLSQLEFGALIECTPTYLGRDPQLLLEISEKTGIHFITNTGYYGAVDNKYLPPHAHTESDRQLANRWIKEWKEGIDGTGIKPGFIKISVNNEPLSALHQKLVRAAALTHLTTGLTIASHTGGYTPASEQVALLKKMGVRPNAFIWVHAQGENDLDRHIELAKEGVWVSLDGIQPNNLDSYLKSVKNLKEAGLLHKVLISHDAGWFRPEEKNGGTFRPFDTISQEFVPLLLENDFTEDDIHQLLTENPARAFTIHIKKIP
ncbi:MAG: phosphotriesterase [Cyclobacteriaceae bacterium]